VQVALTESQNSERLAWPLFAGVISQLRERLRDSSDRSIAQRVAGGAFLIRVFSAALLYLLQVFLARWMGSSEFGIYVYVWTLVLMIGDAADLGLATAAQRFVPEYTSRGAFDLLRGFLSRSRWFAVGGASLFAAGGILVLQVFEDSISSYLLVPLSIALVSLPFYGLMQMQDGISRAYNWIHIALLPTYIVRHLVMLAIMTSAYLLGFASNATTAVTAVAVSLMLTAAGQTLALNRKLARTVEPGPKAQEARTWFKVALPILLVEGFYVLLTNTDILVLQQYRSTEDLGLYYAAAKTLMLIAFVHFAVSAAVAHRFSEYHATDNREQLETILRDAIRWTFWASLAACVVVLAMGRPLLWLFGPQFTDGYHLMFILAAGLMARASIGPVERLLNMLGQQHVCAAVYAGAFVLNLVLCIVLIPRIGVEGAAVATATALIVESFLLFWVTKRRLGLHVFIWGRR
jgi:O-antigen/teichoic acid export membrane protein